jgi:futalosine hydrolase
MILLACAVERELAFWTHRHDVETLVTGVGPVEAACAIAHALAQQRYKLVVNAGIAGAVDAAANVGDGVVVADEALELALENGRPIVLPERQSVVDKAHSNPLLVAELRRRGFAALRGITVSRVTAREDTAVRLARLGAQVESMEGFAVLRACERAGVPAVELRGISNRVGDRDVSGWDFEAGISGLARVTQALFEIIDASSTATA